MNQQVGKKNVPLWPQLPIENRMRLSHCLFFVALNQVGGIRHDSPQSEKESSAAQSSHLHSPILAASDYR